MIQSLLIANRGKIACHIIRPALLTLSLIATTSCASAQTPGTQQRSVQVDGMKRTYIQVVPDICKAANARCAVVFGFHGGGLPGVSGAQFDKQTGLGNAALERGFIAIMPDGRSMNWNDGRPEVREKADDVGFVRTIIQSVAAEKLSYDPARVFATGMSNGGHMSFRLACEMSDVFSAVAPVVASLGKVLSEQCKPKKAISILNIVGDADPLTPYNGGQIGLKNKVSRGEGLSSDASMAFWAKANGCKSAPTTMRFDKDKTDKTSILVDHYAGCANGKVMERYVVVGGGHLWPGEFPKGIVAMISGTPTKEFKATDVILDFFSIPKVKAQ
jgi:polyhydroxybutyrate depolymerase